MIRALAFLVVRLAELVLAIVYPLAPSACVLAAVALDPLHEALRPRVLPGRFTDLRLVYRELTP